MVRPGAVRVFALVAGLWLVGCGAGAAPVDPVAAAITEGRMRERIATSLNGLLHAPLEEVRAAGPPLLRGDELASVELDDGSTRHLWRGEAGPWILQFHPDGGMVRWDVPMLGLGGRSDLEAADESMQARKQRLATRSGLEGLIGLPLYEFVGDGFDPIEVRTAPDATQTIVFRTEGSDYLVLETDSEGLIADWSSTIPGLQRPLRRFAASGASSAFTRPSDAGAVAGIR